jgi:hypothetical protein
MEQLSLGLAQPVLDVLHVTETDPTDTVTQLVQAVNTLTDYLSAQQRYLEDVIAFMLESISNRHLIDTLANRPPAEEEGRLFYASDTHTLYIDTGTAWDAFVASGFLTWDTA